MPNLYNYVEATKKCQELTAQMVEDVGIIVFSLRALEHTILLANTEVESAARHATPTSERDNSLTYYMLVRELKKLNFSLETLKAAIKRKISDSLAYLNTVTAGLRAGVQHDPISEEFLEYRKVLIKSVLTLKKLDDELFCCEIESVGSQ